MATDLWFKKAENHIKSAEILLNENHCSSVINLSFLAMFSAINALLIKMDIDCRTHEGLIYLFKVHYVDKGRFNKRFFNFYCKTKDLNTKYFNRQCMDFDCDLAFDVLSNTKKFISYSKNIFYSD